ncbi:BON domain-containing protein [Methylobacterium sp. Leaf88]|uniref:BON domain-containing protein n=1 Tax=Methylobacterium sp. Leaf88 TaxID=1736244 RepID=UPI0006FDD480|nr:BON domain-containing protein [Methylobacterium sp. Leaf88]KQO78286.1 ornithine aminotransferase [Methylobacterium sp. Leaf88]
MDDRTLRQHVLEELDFDPKVDAAHIGVTVRDGLVTLSGHVATYAEKIAAEKVAQRVRGVRAVVEEIEVRYPADQKTGDEELAARVVKVLAWNVQVPDEAIKVKVEEGRVTLDGCVPWYYQRAAAQSAVAKLAGVREVLNLLAVKPSVRSRDVKAKVLAALKRTARDPDTITVRVEGDTVILDGCVDLWRERELAERAAWSTPGVHAVDDRLRLAW